MFPCCLSVVSGQPSFCERAPRQHYCVMGLNEMKQNIHIKTTRPASPAPMWKQDYAINSTSRKIQPGQKHICEKPGSSVYLDVSIKCIETDPADCTNTPAVAAVLAKLSPEIVTLKKDLTG